MRAYIIHVSDAYDREEHMQNQLKDKDLDSIFILDGDKQTLTQPLIDEFFKGDIMAKVSNTTSCAYKHILAYQKVAEGNDSVALILEDDIRFYSNFSVLQDILREIKERELQSFIISLEDSDLRYVGKSERRKGQLIYPKEDGRFAGAYLIDKVAATNLLAYVKKAKIGIPIDWFHNECMREGVLQMYWSHPPLALQGSLDGSIRSLIDNKKFGCFRRASFRIQKIYKKCLYFFR